MVTDDTLTGLLRSIILNSDEDAPRLMYADRLDELAESAEWVECKRCCVRGWIPNDEGGVDDPLTKTCPVCNGVGTVLDTTLRDRAEFIRAQCGGFSAMKCKKPYPHSDRIKCSIRLDHYQGYERTRHWCEVCYKTVRERELWDGLKAAPAHRLSHWSRGFRTTLECTARTFLVHADELIWHPAQTIRCSAKGCEDGTIGKPRKGDVGGQWMGRMCDSCVGSGRIYSPCPLTAQPIRKVLFTNDPEAVVHRFGDFKWVLVAETGLNVWRHPNWPGIEFGMPAHSDLIEYDG